MTNHYLCIIPKSAFVHVVMIYMPLLYCSGSRVLVAAESVSQFAVVPPDELLVNEYIVPSLDKLEAL